MTIANLSGVSNKMAHNMQTQKAYQWIFKGAVDKGSARCAPCAPCPPCPAQRGGEDSGATSSSNVRSAVSSNTTSAPAVGALLTGVTTRVRVDWLEAPPASRMV
jgi:hypothetical protein